MELSWPAVVARRLQRQGIASGHGDIATAVSAMRGAHAQVMSAAELSIAVRVPDATAESVRAELLPSGSLVKTYGPRGTVHLLPRGELGKWCAALDAVPFSTSQPAGTRLEPDERESVIAAIGSALAGSGPLDGNELGRAVVDRLGPWADERVVPAFGGQWPRWRLAIQSAAYRGVLAFGENRGSRVTYVSPSIEPEPDVQKALTWLLTGYLATYGPATADNYARWLGVKRSWAAQQFATADVERLTVEGESAFVNRGDSTAPASAESTVRLLPHFDPYVIGSFPRERLFPGAAATRALGRGQAGVHPVLLVDGIVAGIWTGQRSGSQFALTVEPFGELSAGQSRALEAVAARIGAFQGAEAHVTIGEVRTGAHK